MVGLWIAVFRSKRVGGTAGIRRSSSPEAGTRFARCNQRSLPSELMIRLVSWSWTPSLMPPSKRLKLLTDRLEMLLVDLDRRETLLEDMGKLGSEIDHAYRAASDQRLSASELEQLEHFRAAKQQAIEKLRAVADAIVLDCFRYHEEVAKSLLEAATQDSALLPLADQARALALSRRRDKGTLIRNLIAARQLLVQAETVQSSPPVPEPAAPAPTTSAGPVLLTAGQFAELLQVSSKTVYRLAAQGRIPCVRAGRSLRFPREPIESWLREGRWPSKARIRRS